MFSVGIVTLLNHNNTLIFWTAKVLHFMSSVNIVTLFNHNNTLFFFNTKGFYMSEERMSIYFRLWESWW